MSYIKFLNEVSKEDIKDVGGKGASLGELIGVGLPIPNGFIITTQAYKQFSNQELPVDLIEKIFRAFEKLGVETVAVRSSAISEDSSTSSWAGQLESYLNVNKSDLIDRVRDCWNSIKSERALSYAAEQGINQEEQHMAVVIQKMVASEVSGVMFTVNPITQNTHEVMIEAGLGLGEMLVQGLITPDNFLVDKNSLVIKERNIGTQGTMLILQDGENKEVPVPNDKKNQPTLTDYQIKELAKLAISIEKHYGTAQDIEWAFENKKFFITQSRPITTLSLYTTFKSSNEYELTFSRECIMLTLQVWYISENDKFSKYIDYQFPPSGWMFFEYISGLARNYIDLSLIKNAYNFALTRALQEPEYFENIEKSFWDKLDLVKPYLIGDKQIKTKEELEAFFNNVTEVWGAQTICYAFTYFENPHMTKNIFKRSEKIRLAIETIIDDCNKVFIKALKNIFVEKYIEDYNYLTLEEIISEKIPSKKILLQRSKYIIYFKGIQYDDSLENFLIRENKYLEKVEYGDTGSLKGQTAYPGRISGVVKICFTTKEMSKVEEGDILVTSMTTPHFLPAIRLASAIVTDEGGVMSHAAIVSREMKKPCIVGTKSATKVLKDGEMIEVDADNGFVRMLTKN